MGNPKKGKAKAKPSGSAKKKANSKAAASKEPMEVEGAQEEAGPSIPAVWRPGVDDVGEDEELQYDRTAYDCMHAFSHEWPCLR